ncbi:MAG TPA: hypothetical protein P5305_01430 [Rubrivivax sp.]|nr:hypothetical protein [Rubrivivax sp.]
MTNTVLDKRLLDMAQRAGRTGISLMDVTGESVRHSYNITMRLVAHGLLHKGKVGHRTVRFFTRAEWAKDYERTRKAPAERPTVLRAAWDADTPAIYPTHPDGSPAYKYTVCESNFDPLDAAIRNRQRWSADPIIRGT